MNAQEGRPPHVLVAGVGYSFLRDWSIGPWLAADLQRRTWAPGVEIDDWSFGPLDAVHKLQAAEPPFDRVIFFGAVQRGRPPGTVVRRAWDGADLPSPEVVQDRVGEAISGVLSLDNLVFMCATFKALPDDVVLFEIEPTEDETYGESYSDVVAAAVPRLVGYIEQEVAAARIVAAAPHDEQIVAAASHEDRK